jgi:hypothetical protein
VENKESNTIFTPKRDAAVKPPPDEPTGPEDNIQTIFKDARSSINDDPNSEPTQDVLSRPIVNQSDPDSSYATDVDHPVQLSDLSSSGNNKSTGQDSITDSGRKSALKRLAERSNVLLVIVILLAGAGIFAAVANGGTQQNNISETGRFGKLSLPLKDIIKGKNLDVTTDSGIAINGAMRVNSSLVMTPSIQPTMAVAGQLYYDKGVNKLAYYNGKNFVYMDRSTSTIIDNSKTTIIDNTKTTTVDNTRTIMVDNSTTTTIDNTQTNVIGVSSIAGVDGQITLGAGLNMAAKQLENSGVLSFQGQAGDITLTPGQGVSISGTTITNAGVLSTNGQVGALTIANSSAALGTITIDDASTTAKGIASFNGTNFTVTNGAVNTAQDITTGSTPTFAGLNTNIITPSSSMTIGAVTHTLLLQGSTTSITSTVGGVTNTLLFVTPTATNKTITIPDETGIICLQGSSSCGFAAGTTASYIQNQNASDQTANLRITGTAQVNTSVLAPLLDTATAVTLGIGATNATGISLNQNTVVAASKTLTVTSALTSLTGATTGDALNVNNSTSTGNIAVFNDNGSAVFTIADGGAVTATSSISAVGLNSGAGLLQGTGGLTVSGTTSINSSANYATNIGTGTSTGTITIGGGSSPLVIIQ